MIGSLARLFDNILGRGEAAVTVPPLDGALRPNRLLDEAEWRVPLADVESLAVADSRLFASAGNVLHVLDADGAWHKRGEYDAEIACLAPLGTDGLVVALASGEIICKGGKFDSRSYRASAEVACITALAVSGTSLLVANGSASNGRLEWQRDLLQRNASGSVWTIDLDNGRGTRLASGLAWPAGLAVDGGEVVVSEAWKHRLIRIDSSAPAGLQTLHADLPGYPGSISPSAEGYWLAVFAPRSQLVEFVLREPAYCKRMMAEVPQPFWVAPKLRSGRSFYETLQGGGVKHLGMLKPWAPTMSAGLCVRLDRAFQPRCSLQSRADGRTHGVTGAVELQGRVYVAARGDGVVVSLPLAGLGGGA